MHTHRKGCAVVACFGQRLKNMIGKVQFQWSCAAFPSTRAPADCVVMCDRSVYRLCNSIAVFRLGVGSDGGGARAARGVGVFIWGNRYAGEDIAGVVGASNGARRQRSGSACLEAEAGGTAAQFALQAVHHGSPLHRTAPLPLQVQLRAQTPGPHLVSWCAHAPCACQCVPVAGWTASLLCSICILFFCVYCGVFLFSHTTARDCS